jgi:hypothetical protein
MATPDAGFGDYLWLRLTSKGCGIWAPARIVGDPQALAVGSFQGSVIESSSGTMGLLFDDITDIQFETDLPIDDIAGLLGSLRPFDPNAEPEQLAATRRNDPKTPVRRPTALVACGHQRKEVVQRMNDGSHGTLEVAGR